jgi:hypothetical protein
VLLQVRGDFPLDGDEASTFFLRKAELAVQARVSPWTHLRVELDPVRPSDPFRRTYVQLTPFRRLHVKLGMEKAPVGLDELLSSARVPFVDRSEVSDRFSAAEEVGVHLESRWDRVIAQASLTNGGRRLLRDDNDHKDVSARVVWAVRPSVTLGVSALSGRAGVEERVRRRYNGELRLGSYDGGAQVEFYDARDGGVDSHAFYAAAFHLIPLERFDGVGIQPGIRYERIDRDDDLRDEEVSLLTLGANVLFDGHSSKLQVDYLRDLRDGLDEDVLRMQYQVEF